MWELHERKEKAAAPRLPRNAVPQPHKGRPHSSSNRSENLATIRKKSRPQSRMDSTRHSDGKQIIQEARRTMTLASATSHAIVDTFLERIKSYQTFQPLFAANKLYAHSTSVTDEDSPTKQQNPWEVIDNLIETSTHHLLRNRADEHFFASFGRVTGETFRPRKRSHKVGFAHREDLVDMHGEAIEKKNRTFMDTWKRDHPLHTDDDNQDETCFWSSAFSEQDRTARLEYLKQLHREIDSLVLLSNKFDQEQQNQLKEQTRESLTEEGNTEDAVDARTAEQQRRAWIMFCKGEDCTPGFIIPEKTTPIVSDYENTEDLHDWIQHRWLHHTHRHENAAFIIQRAYRSYMAKCTTEKKRYARWQLLRETQAAEEEGAKKWLIALQEERQKHVHSSENTPESRAIRFFSKKVVAVVAKKRALKAEQAAEQLEIQTYAATLIQKMFRGYMTRTCSLLHPEVQASRRQQKCNDAAYRIQGTWRRMLALRRWKEMKAAVLKIQCAFRQYMARRRCRLLRGLHRIDLDDAQKKTAAHTLVSFGMQNIYKRNVFYKKNKEAIDLLQRVGRGFIHRMFTYNIPWEKEKVVAADFISSRWKDILTVRRAKFYVGTFEKRRERNNWQQIRSDAAVTIQLAWRNYIGLKQSGVTNSNTSSSKSGSEKPSVLDKDHNAETPPVKKLSADDANAQPECLLATGPPSPVTDYPDDTNCPQDSSPALNKGVQFPSASNSAIVPGQSDHNM